MTMESKDWQPNYSQFSPLVAEQLKKDRQEWIDRECKTKQYRTFWEGTISQDSDVWYCNDAWPLKNY
jgi:hypothetical protein